MIEEWAFSEPVGDFVFPRLGRGVALRLVEEGRTLTLAELFDMSALDHPEAAPAPTGTRVDTERLTAIRAAVREAASARGYPEPLRRGREWTFDSLVGRILHQEMRILPADAAHEGVWSFLTLVVAPEVGPWRFPDRAQDRLVGHPRNVLRRAWWRAHVLGDDLDWAPEGQQPLGEDELVQIMERPTLAANPRVARAVRDGIFECGAKASAARSELARDLTKRVLRLTPFLCLDVLDDSQLTALVSNLVQESSDALRS